MTIIDIILIIILAGFSINGLRKGIINLVGRFLGLIIGLIISSNFHVSVFYWAQSSFNISGNEFLGKIITFILLFIIVTFLIDLIFKAIEKIFNIVAIIPGSRYVNNLAGGLLGFLEGALFLGLIVYISSQYAVLGDLLNLNDQLSSSFIIPFLLKIINLILPFLPKALRLLKEVV